jgi:hypothetical protein
VKKTILKNSSLNINQINENGDNSLRVIELINENKLEIKENKENENNKEKEKNSIEIELKTKLNELNTEYNIEKDKYSKSLEINKVENKN